MLPEQMKVTCNCSDARADRPAGSDTEDLAQIVDRGDMGVSDDGSRTLEIRCTVTPTDDHGVDAVFGRTLDVVGPVADHDDALRNRIELGQRVSEHVAFGGPRAVGARAGDHLEVFVEAEVRQYPTCGGLGLR